MDTKGRGMNEEIGIDINTLLCIKCITNAEPTVQQSELHLMLCGDLTGKEIQKRGDVCIHLAGSLCSVAQTDIAV